MMRKIAIGAVSLFTLFAGNFLLFTPSVSADIVQTNCAVKETFVLGFPAWSNGLKCLHNNESSAPAEARTPRPGITKLEDIWIVVMNIIQWIIILTGYAAILFIMIGGFNYITARGEPSKIVEAKGTITHAIVGLVIALSAVMVVRTIQAGIVSGSII